MPISSADKVRCYIVIGAGLLLGAAAALRIIMDIVTHCL